MNKKGGCSLNKVSTKEFLFDVSVFTYLASVIYFVIARPSEESLLSLSSLALIFLSSLVVGVLSFLLLRKMNALMLGRVIFAPVQEKLSWPHTTLWRSFWWWQLVVLSVITLVVGIQVTHFSLYELFDKFGFQGAKRIFGALMTPEWSILPQGILAIVETIFIAFMATAFAIPIAFLLAFFAAKNIAGDHAVLRVVYTVLRTLMNMTRSIEPLIWAIIFSVWVGIGPFAGMLALFLQSIASLVKQYSEIIECVEEGPVEGVRATGANAIQVIWYAIVPQVILPYISFTIYRWDINVRMATVIGLVGGGGIGTLLVQYQGQALWHEVGALAFLIIVVVWLMDSASAHLREALK